MKLGKLIAIALASSLALTGCAAAQTDQEVPTSEPQQSETQIEQLQVATISTTNGLVSTEELLDDAAENRVILHIAREDGVYERGHIPGARKLDWFTGLTGGGEPNRGVKRGIIDQESFQAIARDLGINKDSEVVVYGETHQLFATWAVWVFKIYGHTNTRLLDGGLAKWSAEGRELSLVPTTFEPGNFEAQPANLELRAFVEEVVAAVEDEDDNKIIVDNRNFESYTGEAESGAKFDGHVASAENLFSRGLFNEDGSYINADEIRERYEAIGVSGDQEIILYCGTGLLASASWFALTQILGYENVQNYDGSWTEYGNLDNVPIEGADA